MERISGCGNDSLSKGGEELPIPAGKVYSVGNIGKTTARRLYGYKRPR